MVRSAEGKSAAGNGLGLSGRELALLAVLAGLARLVYMLAVRDEVLFQAVIGDSAVHVERARALLAGVRAEQHAFTPPLYPALLAAVFGLCGERLELVRWLQAAGGVAACLALALAAAMTRGRGAAWVAGLIMAFSPLLLFFEGELLSAAPVVALLAAALAVLAFAANRDRHRGWGWWTLGGALLGAAALGQPNVLVVVAGLALWCGRRVRRLAALAAGLLIMLAAGVGLQHQASGYWVPIAASGGVNLYIGNHPGAAGGFELPPESGLENEALGLYPAARAVAAAALAGAPPAALGPRQVSAYWAGRAWRFMALDPATAARLLGRKLLLLLNHDEVPNHYDPDYFGRYTPLLRWNPLRFWWIGPLGLVGLGLGAARRRAPDVGLALGAAAYAASVVLFFVTSRYRLPLWPFLAIGCGTALTRLAQERRHPRRWSLPAAAMLSLALGSWLPVAPPFSAARMPGLLAQELRRRGDEQGARAVLEAVADQPDLLPEVAHNLGNALYREGRYAEAAAAYQRALAMAPDFAPALGGLGRCELLLGHPQRAAELLAAALAGRPGDRNTRQALGRALLVSGRAAAAVAILEPLQGDGVTVPQLVDYGLACLQAGRLGAARAALEAARRRAPGDARVQRALAALDAQREPAPASAPRGP